MQRGIRNRNILDRFCIDFCKILEKYTPYIIVSGFVAISSGRTRATEDIDMILPHLSEEKFKAIHQDLIRQGFICVQSDHPETIYQEYLLTHTSVRYTWKNKPLPEMEIKFARDQLDTYQLQTRQKLPLTGLPVWFGSIDMNIAFKEEYLKSEKDLEDAKHLRIVYAEQINEEEIRKIKRLIRKYRL